MPAGPRKPVERHNGRVYRPTLDVAVGFVDFFHATGWSLGTQTFRAAGVVRIVPTHTLFRVAVTFAFYLHKFFGWPGVLHFTYTLVRPRRAPFS